MDIGEVPPLKLMVDNTVVPLITLTVFESKFATYIPPFTIKDILYT
jgi:hypothetical protein